VKRWIKAEPLLWHAFAVLLVLGLAAAFYGSALRRAPQIFPAPLDDVYIHFGFARSAALGHPFEWIPGNGYSSGGTSLTYPLLLAPGYLLGFRGARLGVFAAAIACAALVDLCRSARELARRAPRGVAWAACPLLLGVPLLDWSFFSGMETALVAALTGRALVAVRRAELAPPARRAKAQTRAGILFAILVATRPETIALAAPLAVAVAHAAGSLNVVASLARASIPTGAFLAAQAIANRAFTGEWAAAGAVRKLLGSNPYTTPLDDAVEVIKNIIALRSMALEAALGRYPFALVVPILGIIAALDRRSRRLAVPLLLGAVGALLLVSLNSTARYQNLRYAAPSLIMLLAAAALGAGALARAGASRQSRALGVLAGASMLTATLAPARFFPAQIDYFARASANITEQQVEVAARIAARPEKPRAVLVGDAGAIPYLSGVRAIDGLGLGGYRGLPFARASVHGVPSVIELIERLDPSERPDLLALYPSWWRGLADVFGRKVDAVRIEDNVMCAADEKVIYEADWSPLAPPGEARPGAFDALDVADLVDERAHAYEAPFPRGGWVIGAVLLDERGARRFDAGRIVPEGRSESFRVAASAPRGPATLVLRTDGGGEIALRVAVEREDPGARVPRVLSTTAVIVPPRPGEADAAPAIAPARWHEVRVPLADIGGGDRVRIFAERNAWRGFHSWLVRP
jgi:hypothetical protein